MPADAVLKIRDRGGERRGVLQLGLIIGAADDKNSDRHGDQECGRPHHRVAKRLRHQTLVAAQSAAHMSGRGHRVTEREIG